MAYRIFLAGASGAIGRRLIPLLREAGHDVAGATRSAAKADAVHALGAEPVVINVFDEDALVGAFARFQPEIVINQLTDLPPGLDPGQMAQAIVRNARVRTEGTRNLVKAALFAGARRMVAQSIAWVYGPGPEPHSENDPVDPGEGDRAISMAVVAALEDSVLNSPPLEGLVLRYGHLYGPGTGADAPRGASPLHVDAAAYAALLAIDKGSPGIFNIAESNPHIATEKARDTLGWRSDFRIAR
jgi:nucleoside-diphosphate-sugar epimerase